ncbi:MAG TPA: CCA tRNA nucleotidyltransferase [Candidatus Angelobacter sp.]|nr:CCA tRNA nucleotidyltransferase [Candidatus Angelobacter sp.]
MPQPHETVLQQVAKKIVPSDEERDRMTRLSQSIQRKVEEILARSQTQATVSLQGSFARDTWISGETDLDIFARFSPTMDKEEWVEKVLPTMRKHFSRYRVIERYAEHPFLEFRVSGVRVNIVPAYDVKKGEWKSATDRTPYHTEFMQTHLTPEHRRQARLLKKFAKGIGTYGAEVKIGGFSGMLIDTLILYYQSFIETIRHASLWNRGTFLEIGKPGGSVSQKEKDLNADLVVTDPVDPNRNLAAAVRADKLWSFVAAGRQFLRDPGVWYFFPPEFKPKTRQQFAKQVEHTGHELLAITFKHPVLVPDVLWGQLMKLERSLLDMMAREEFGPYRSVLWSDETKESAIIVEADRTVLPEVRLRKGPPVSKSEDSTSFLEKHLRARDTVRGPWIEGDRWIVERKRGILSIRDLVKAALREEAYALSMPKQLDRSFRRSVKVLQGREVLSMLGRKGFDKSLWEFLEAKPSWLMSPS